MKRSTSSRHRQTQDIVVQSALSPSEIVRNYDKQQHRQSGVREFSSGQTHRRAIQLLSIRMRGPIGNGHRVLTMLAKWDRYDRQSEARQHSPRAMAKNSSTIRTSTLRQFRQS